MGLRSSTSIPGGTSLPKKSSSMEFNRTDTSEAVITAKKEPSGPASILKISLHRDRLAIVVLPSNLWTGWITGALGKHIRRSKAKLVYNNLTRTNNYLGIEVRPRHSKLDEEFLIALLVSRKF